ncbi:hypothetical protein NDU88_001441, partial [Pleurodeles waltl]
GAGSFRDVVSLLIVYCLHPMKWDTPSMRTWNSSMSCLCTHIVTDEYGWKAKLTHMEHTWAKQSPENQIGIQIALLQETHLIHYTDSAIGTEWAACRLA